MDREGQTTHQTEELAPEKWVDMSGVSRRTVLKTGIAAGVAGLGYAAVTQPIQAQTVITTSTEGLTAGMVTVKSKDGKDMPAYRAMPARGTGFGTILVCEEIFGINEHIADICRRFAKAGYYAIAPEIYFRYGDPKPMTDFQQIIREIVSKTSDAEIMGDFDSAAEFAKGEGKADMAKLGVTGFCFGGRVTWMYSAHNPAIKAGVAWYGRLVGQASANNPKHPVDIAKDLKGPVLGLYGGQDQGIPLDTVEKMKEALKAAGTPAASKSMFHVYPDAPHAFLADYRPSFRKETAEDGWKRCLEWFRANGVTGVTA